jgi:hypothetical protein
MKGLVSILGFSFIVLSMFFIVVPLLHAQGNRTGINTNTNGIAIKGYDPVAYHTLGRPILGSPTINYQWMNATWQFSTTQHRDLFAENPERYAPQFGGYCSWAVSRGSLADIDPNAWHIENGLLYLNLNPRINRSFIANVQDNIRRAETNWPALRNRLQNN